MTTYNTGNPLGSAAAKDLYDNSQNFDHLSSDRQNETWPDRFGIPRLTWFGMEEKFKQAISSMGWILVNSFQAGADITLPNQALHDEASGEYYRWDGPLPKHVDAGSTPDSTGGVGVGAWIGVGDASLRAYLATTVGAAAIGLQPGGNLQQAITWVTPEQFGAIGDGTVHPLSERYSTLAAAQAVYPHVTSLDQTIDWAACQAAENYARGTTEVRCPSYAQYHFGDNGLQLGENSKWKGSANVQNDKPATTMIRNVPASTPIFGQCYIVRVMPAPIGSADDSIRGVSFQGFKLRYPVARRTPVKGTNTICLHIGQSIRAVWDVSCWGGEYGAYTWASWANEGHLRFDSCHKGYFSVPQLGDGERAGSGTITSNRLRIECDVTPFPITLGNDSYSQYNGYFEGSVASDGNYDNANETACGITVIGAANSCAFDMGIEKWEGVHYCDTGNGSVVNLRFGWFTDKHYSMLTGNDGSDASIRLINGTSGSKISLPPAQRAYINNLSGNVTVTVSDTYYYMANIFTETTTTRYLCNIQGNTSLFNFSGGRVGFVPESGGAPVAFCPNETMKARVQSIGCYSLDIWCSPSTSWRLIGLNRWIRTSPTSINGTLDGTNGYFADFTAPTGYFIQDVRRLVTNLGDSGASLSYKPGFVSYNSSTGSLRVATSYAGGTVPSFSGIVEISQ